MARNYPPLNALLFFVTAARTLSFTRTAEELFVTRSAVSRQIKGLEDFLSVGLFHRAKSGLELTPAGVSYANALSLCFADIKLATDTIMGQQGERKFKLGLSATFNSTWLIGRLNRLYDLHPELAVAFVTNALDTTEESVDFSSGIMDAAVRLGNGKWAGCQSDKLLDIHIQLVCAPELLRAPDAVMSLFELEAQPWLGYKHLPELWSNWLAEAGCGSSVLARKRVMTFDNVAVAVQAAVDGLGIIPMYRPLVDPLLDSGKLVVAHDFKMLSEKAYYFVCPSNYTAHKPTVLFREWIIAEAEMFMRRRFLPSGE
ncbi:LysR substrate-binding domain-containing protein [uncultured Microbulbifer sp.]|uniref:LysR substrate-binding domain-containing protein n=1 Tax=uncultured Microbulbifer sp. TaxID=348147 RepID=UPI002605A7F9|nr:LysR substrate-binding domain-containing protein [uncultured Microbulbifer sp.]